MNKLKEGKNKKGQKKQKETPKKFKEYVNKKLKKQIMTEWKNKIKNQTN